MNSGRYRLPHGAKLVTESRDKFVLSVELPADDDGYFGRRCPSCKQIFRVHYEDYEALPDNLRLWCVYCGHEDDHSEFPTAQQVERIMRPAGDIAMQMVGKALDDSFGRISRRSSGSMVSFTYRSRPFYPEPLPGISEERLVRERSCDSCSLRYAVFGDHRFCPVCGLLPPGTIALDALSAERMRLHVLDSLPVDSLASLREQGVIHRVYVDTIENLVGIVETLAEAIFRSRVPDADEVVKGRGKIFQRLGDTADEFNSRLGVDIRGSVGVVTWEVLEGAWAARHVFTHRDGIVDERYLAQVPQSELKVGQRLVLTEPSVREALDATAALCDVISSSIDSHHA